MLFNSYVFLYIYIQLNNKQLYNNWIFSSLQQNRFITILCSLTVHYTHTNSLDTRVASSNFNYIQACFSVTQYVTWCFYSRKSMRFTRIFTTKSHQFIRSSESGIICALDQDSAEIAATRDSYENRPAKINRKRARGRAWAWARATARTSPRKKDVTWLCGCATWDR